MKRKSCLLEFSSRESSFLVCTHRPGINAEEEAVFRVADVITEGDGVRVGHAIRHLVSERAQSSVVSPEI